MLPVLLCGGFGNRLWPEKKIFSKFFGRQGQNSLIDISLKRLKKFEPIFIISHQNLKPDLESALKNHNIKTEIIYEPESKNTAVSIALICYLLSKKRNSEEIIGFFPSDHFIGQELKFQKYLRTAVQITKDKGDQLLTFGIPPERPSSSYGYIKTGDAFKQIQKITIKKAIRFVEKPDLSKSSDLLKQGYLWNSGIFLSPLGLLVRYFKMFLPDLWETILRLEVDSLPSVYKNLKPLSFDTGIMEKLDSYLCLPCNMDWLDFGLWDHVSAWDQKFPRKLNNKAKKYEKNCKNNFIFSSKEKIIAVIGVKDSLIINGEKGLLIAKKTKSEELRSIASKLQNQNKMDKKTLGSLSC